MLEELLEEYYEKFGENYPLMITSMLSSEEIIDDIRACLESGKPAQPMELDPELDY